MHMPWKEATAMSLRIEFVQAAFEPGLSMSELCRRFGISRKTGYKWLNRFRDADGDLASLADRSRRPHSSPRQTPRVMEEAVLRIRDTHPAWGGRKIRARLLKLEYVGVPSASTVTAILRRHGRLDAQECAKHAPFQRFEMDRPNQLWQMDFKGYFPLVNGGDCHPLTVLDDHSRFLLGLKACSDETRISVEESLTTVFRQYGLPESILVDNGAPWGSSTVGRYTQLAAWLMRLGIQVIHSRPYHPQTLGKDERLHRTLKAEVITRSSLQTLEQCQHAFDTWRPIYNQVRPHEALDMSTPATRYQPSSRRFPEPLPPLQYGITDIVRKVQASGRIYFRNQRFRVGKAFKGQIVALRPLNLDGGFEVFFCNQRIARFTLDHDNDTANQL
jgi:transposase InsO family protein